MAATYNKDLNAYIKASRKRARRKTLFSLVACLVAIGTLSALTLPAISQTDELFCNLEEHLHTEQCFSTELVCMAEEPLPDEESTDLLSAEEEEEPVEEQEEEPIVTPEEEPSSQAPEEGEEEEPVPPEPQQTVDDEPVPEEPEDQPTEQDLSDQSEHIHDQTCYKQVLICELTEHTHKLACRSNPQADLETPAQWEASLAGAELTGNGPLDLLAIAKTQVGYRESSRNFVVVADGTTVEGYNRYGAWYGQPYLPWNTLFLAFCADYAQTDQIPTAERADDLLQQLCENGGGLVSTVDSNPTAGDLIFFDIDDDGTADRVGIVEEYSVTDHEIYTIEGDAAGRADRVTYDLQDSTVMGYVPMNIPAEDPQMEFAPPPQAENQLYHPPDFGQYQIGSHKVDGMPTLTYVLVPAEDYGAGEWFPSAAQWSADADANYLVAYGLESGQPVSDIGAVYTAHSVYDSEEYQDYAQALAGIVEHAYPFISAEEMKTQLAQAFEKGEIDIDLSCCTESELLAAAQWAIWDASGKNEIQPTVEDCTFPDDMSAVLNPLEDVGHTQAEDIQTHVQAIRDWLAAHPATARLAAAGYQTQVQRQHDGSYHLTTVVDLNRPLQAQEVLLVRLAADDALFNTTVTGEGTQQFTLSMTDLTAQQAARTTVFMNVYHEHMQTFVYEGAEYQDMIGGRWGEEVYDLSFEAAPELVGAEVTKEWDIPPTEETSVQIQLYADGQAYGAPIELNSSNSWYYRWDKLLKYSAAETEIEYTLRETLVPGYLSTITGGKTDGTAAVNEEEVLLPILANTETGFSYLVTNTLTEEQISISVSNQWAGREDGIYPETLEVNLLQNGQIYGNPVTLNAENGWTYRWEQLPLKIGDQTFAYSVQQVPVYDYTVTVQETQNPDGSVNFALCSTWNPEYISVLLNKVDALDLDQPLSGAKFRLYQAAAPGDVGAVTVPYTEDVWGILTQTSTTDSDGALLLENLWVGRTYYLAEVKAPPGYRLITDPIAFTVVKDSEGSNRLSILSGDPLATSVTEDDGDPVLQIGGLQSFVLPETGGIGTARYYTTGVLFVILATILFIHNQKHKERGVKQ